MIIYNYLSESAKVLTPALKQLISTLEEKQSHPGDMLLINQHGYFEENVPSGLSPYVFGSGMPGRAHDTHLKFIDDYRRPNVVDSIEKVPKQIRPLQIQLEMLIYLKVWEGETFLKYFYQIQKLLEGNAYDWHMVFDTNVSRSILIRKSKEEIRKYVPKISEEIDVAYNSQIRNAIAHSQYSISETRNNIILGNCRPNSTYSNKEFVTCDEWNMIFSKTMALYDEVMKMMNNINKKYAYQQNVEVRISEKNGTEEFRELTHIQRGEHFRWAWKKQLEQA